MNKRNWSHPKCIHLILLFILMKFTWLLKGENQISIIYFMSTTFKELKEFIISSIQDVSREIKM